MGLETRCPTRLALAAVLALTLGSAGIACSFRRSPHPESEAPVKIIAASVPALPTTTVVAASPAPRILPPSSFAQTAAGLVLEAIRGAAAEQTRVPAVPRPVAVTTPPAIALTPNAVLATTAPVAPNHISVPPPTQLPNRFAGPAQVQPAAPGSAGRHAQQDPAIALV